MLCTFFTTTFVMTNWPPIQFSSNSGVPCGFVQSWSPLNHGSVIYYHLIAGVRRINWRLLWMVLLIFTHLLQWLNATIGARQIESLSSFGTQVPKPLSHLMQYLQMYNGCNFLANPLFGHTWATAINSRLAQVIKLCQRNSHLLNVCD